MKKSKQSLGERLRAARGTRTMADVAARCGVSEMTISRLERDVPARIETVERVAAALGLNVEIRTTRKRSGKKQQGLN